MAKDTFEEFRQNNPARRVDNGLLGLGWALMVGPDERDYMIMLQKECNEREPMVRVGCRYFTLKQARTHYVSRGRNSNPSQRRTAKQMLNLIGIAVANAHYRGWLNRTVKFNTTPRKVAR